MYQTKELKLGDVIIDMGKGKEPVAYHALMWVGGEKPLAHATEGKTVSLVVRHRLPYLRGEDIGKFPSPPVDQYYVYRHNNEKVGAKAAEFAILWASDPSATKVTAGEKPKPTPYSPPRRQEGVTVVQALEKLAAADEWDTMALFHAVRAYAKLKNNFALSGRGVSCSQFITYCYQCASIEALVGTISPPKETLFNLIHTDRAIALKTDMNVIAVKRAAIASFTSEPTQERKPPGKTGAELMKAHFFDPTKLNAEDLKLKIAKGLLFDAKYATVPYLQNRLEDKESGFQRYGYAIPKPYEIKEPLTLQVVTHPDFTSIKSTEQFKNVPRSSFTVTWIAKDLDGFA